MVVDSDLTMELDGEEVDRLFHALADRTRRDILAQAMTGDHSVSALARRYPFSFAAVQKHVAVLEKAGLVTKQKHGREQRVVTNIQAIERARTLLDHFERLWVERLERFEAVLEEED
ncbi:MAG: helix-turn-helix domain-containing protein [Acidimicrobiia bacterium]|nr:helix-turn-helix domain-containing protein [Acidimicrobiia bacterium]MDH5519839.1 helix-turn-helix domain-containing protein [Acidimicrobiia bacterium]